MMKDSAIPNMLSLLSLSASHHVQPSHAASEMCTEEGCDVRRSGLPDSFLIPKIARRGWSATVLIQFF